MKNFKLTALAAGTLLSLSAFTANAVPLELISNGGFENTTGITQSSNLRTTATTGPTFVDNWLYAPTATSMAANGGIGNNYSFVYLPGEATTIGAALYHPTTGALVVDRPKLWAVDETPPRGNFIAVDADPIANAYIYQELSGLTVGQEYRLSFDFAGGQYQGRTGDNHESWQVQFGNDVQSTLMLNNLSHGFTGWMTQTFDFIASNTNQRLSFLALGGPDGLPPVSLLDNVSLTEVVEVPEPASLALLVTGLFGIGASRRRAQRNAKAASTLAA